MELLMEKLMAALLLGAAALMGSVVFIVAAWAAYILSLARGRSTWRFRQLRWTEDGIFPDDSAVQEMSATPVMILQAAWNFLFWSAGAGCRPTLERSGSRKYRLHLICFANPSLSPIHP